VALVFLFLGPLLPSLLIVWIIRRHTGAAIPEELPKLAVVLDPVGG